MAVEDRYDCHDTLTRSIYTWSLKMMARGELKIKKKQTIAHLHANCIYMYLLPWNWTCSRGTWKIREMWREGGNRFGSRASIRTHFAVVLESEIPPDKFPRIATGANCQPRISKIVMNRYDSKKICDDDNIMIVSKFKTIPIKNNNISWVKINNYYYNVEKKKNK